MDKSTAHDHQDSGYQEHDNKAELPGSTDGILGFTAGTALNKPELDGTTKAVSLGGIEGDEHESKPIVAELGGNPLLGELTLLLRTMLRGDGWTSLGICVAERR